MNRSRWLTLARVVWVSLAVFYAEAIQIAVTDSTLRARAAALGEKICAENGVARAVEIIERHALEFKRKAPL